jgi:hypothetical protein
MLKSVPGKGNAGMSAGSKHELRLLPLAGALLLASAGASAADKPPAFGVAMPSGWQPGGQRGVSALFQALRASRKQAVPHVPSLVHVDSCADNGARGTLRAAIAEAGEGDTLDLSLLKCSAITLRQGAIPVQLDDLTIVGPGAHRFAIDGAGKDRVFVHYGMGTLRLQQLTVRNGVNAVSGFHVAGGACILSGGNVALDHGAVHGCRTTGEGAYGGGILAGTIVLYTSTLSDNVALGSHPDVFTAAYGGGAMAYFGAIGLYASSVTGNRAAHNLGDTHGSYCTGGGVFADFGSYAVRSTVSGNYSYGTGGGMAGHSGFFISNSTISGNTAKFKAGGGIFARQAADPFVLYNSTLAFNTATVGGGAYIGGVPGAAVLQSTIVAGNAVADMAASAQLTIAGANNLVMSPASGVTLPADTLLADPLLLPLRDNGGPTRTHALAPASPARDTGNNSANLDTDQRGAGYARVVGVAADIGAFEVSSAPPPSAAPTLETWASIALAGLLALAGVRAERGKRRSIVT